ncbi:MAG: hypothetical protein A2937_03205 [Candidatus Yonathbacteria bacterium RIFCSPLOWO2_01_FULL_47_33b]|uniref:DUF5673 domain-containing protein n=1 Tax=Candidatus Yonathbacteria bacterium RIFCSPLOWO2_01_FULL_47_33b TaxID=1802727 RepID=A0A1G2SHP2_9BACT|nr:MAG: hypothetical protein A2937_03205 [Candidatus Yonathbacteria bacterium RIFCSPLOWO2_01_FULL_47_33b]
MDEHKITWDTPAHDHYEHHADWYWAVGIIAVSLAVAFFIVGNALLSIIVLIGVGTLLTYTKHPPEIITCELSRKGVRVGKTFYPWETLESFWILEEHVTEKEHASAKLLLTSQKSFMPHIVIPLVNAPIEDIHHILSQMLIEEPQSEPLPDRVMRKLGF